MVLISRDTISNFNLMHHFVTGMMEFQLDQAGYMMNGDFIILLLQVTLAAQFLFQWSAWPSIMGNYQLGLSCKPDHWPNNQHNTLVLVTRMSHQFTKVGPSYSVLSQDGLITFYKNSWSEYEWETHKIKDVAHENFK